MTEPKLTESEERLFAVFLSLLLPEDQTRALAMKTDVAKTLRSEEKTNAA